MIKSAAKYVRKAGYCEVNLNVGCPSSKVQKGCFGIVLMKDEHRANLAECVHNMWESWHSSDLKLEDSKPKYTEIDTGVTVKCRIGVDHQEGFDFAKEFIQDLGADKNETSKFPDKKGATHFIVHARKAYLKGLNPAENRNVPPLDYQTVIKLAKEFPEYQISINGGFKSYEQIEEILKPENSLKGVMVGRMAMNTPWKLHDVDRRFYGQRNPGYTRREILQIWGQYVDKCIEERPGRKWPYYHKPICNLFAGEPKGRAFKRILSDQKLRKSSKTYSEFMSKVIGAYAKQNEEALDWRPPV